MGIIIFVGIVFIVGGALVLLLNSLFGNKTDKEDDDNDTFGPIYQF